MIRIQSLLAGAALTCAAFGAAADDVKLPSNISWTAYGTTSSGYAQSVAIGNMLKNKYNSELRIIPGKNDVSRMLPVKAGKADLCACGIASYFNAEGAVMFAEPSWGPARLLNLINNNGRNGQMLAIAADAGVEKIADLKGKRIPWVKGAPALNVNMAGHLAFGGLTFDDVVKVEMPGFKQSHDALINNQVDAAVGSTVTAHLNQTAASPRGLKWMAMPFDDEAGWARALAVAPYWKKSMVSVGVALENNSSGKVPFPGVNYPYPIFVALDGKLSDETAYSLVKAIIENYDLIKDGAPSMDGFTLENQSFDWIFPYHPGAIRYYKERGVWTEAAQQHNDALLKRQDVLQAAWSEYNASNPPKDKDAFVTGWLAMRAQKLEAAGMPVPLRDER